MTPRKIIQIGPFEANLEEGLLFRDGHRISIQPQVMRALVYLGNRPGKLVSRQELAHHLWAGWDADDGQSLNVVIRNLRKTLGDNPRAPDYIETIPTKGYRFIGSTACENLIEKSTWRPWRAGFNVAACVAVLAFAFVLSIGHSSRPDLTLDDLPAQARLAYIKGRQHFREGELVASRDQLAQVVDIAPEFAEGYLWLGKTYSGTWGTGLASADIAEPLFHEALRLNPELAEAYAEMGNIALIKYLQAERASELAQKALDLDPDNITAWLVKVDASLAIGKPQIARGFLEKVNQIDPLHLTGRATQGWVAFMAGDFEAAASHCRIALDSGGGMVTSARTCLLEVYLEQNETSLAVAQAKELLKLMNAPISIIDDLASESGKAALDAYYQWRLDRIRANHAADTNPYSEAIYLLKLGRDEAAAQKIRQAVQVRQFPHITFLASDRRFAGLARHAQSRDLFNLYRN